MLSTRIGVAKAIGVGLFLYATAVPAHAASDGAAVSTQQSAPAKANEGSKMISVTGIGGVFFRAKDPKALALWYAKNLGVTATPDSYDEPPWMQQAGPTVFAPFAQDTKYFDRDQQQWMINFRVADLDGIVAQLRKNGNEVKVDPEKYPNGRFARTHDAEGNPIELWEPGGKAPK